MIPNVQVEVAADPPPALHPMNTVPIANRSNPMIFRFILFLPWWILAPNVSFLE
jgi:hypothetical protein